MRAAPALILALALGGCASSSVALFNDEGKDTSGAVAVLDPKTGAEKGQLTKADTQATMRGGGMKVHPLKVAYDHLWGIMPPPPKPYTLYFVTGSEKDLQERSKGDIEVLRGIITPASEVQIIGHTDTVGDEASNDALSLARAQAVRDVLVAAGLPVANAKLTGRGERDPAPGHVTADNVADEENRRVEVIIR